MRPNPVDIAGIVYSSYRNAQLASIAVFTMYTGPASPIPAEKGGFFRVSAYLVTVVAGSAGTCLLTIYWTDPSSAKTLATATIDLAALGSHQVLESNFLVAENQTIRFSTTVAGAAGAPQYDLVIGLERIK